ncbi:ataxin-1a [Conger conger]|uniref:ataxin-1a n=1 Tax=Conger conger TaxID=82655 RepID=UPI002A59F07C|nr:ataxin-1a [Conger conger]XP_061111459.1 ataxin-1a [Conger conger]
MKSNQERSNECLPPKKREIQASNLPSVERPQVAGPASESQRGENLAWLASVASGHDRVGQRTGTPPGSDGPFYKPSSDYSSSSSSHSCSSSVPRAVVTSLPAAYTSALSQPGGTIQYTQLPPNLHFINSSYAGPYAGYISSQLVSPASTPGPPPPRPHPEAYAGAVITQTSAIKAEQRQQVVRSPGIMVSEGGPQYVHITGSSPLSVTSQTVTSPHAHAHLPLHLHSHPGLLPQALALGGPSQVLVQYSPQDRLSKKEDGRGRELLNGELETGRHYRMSPESILGKQGAGAKVGSGQHPHHHHHHQQQHHQQQHHYEARPMMIPAEHTQDTSGLRTSLMLAPNSHGDPGSGPDKPPPPAVTAGDKGGICLGKPVSRASPFAFPAPQPCSTVTTLSPHSVIQTTHSATEQVSVGLPSTGFYPSAGQPPIIGYIAGGQQPPLGYPAGLAPQLVIPGSQPMIIPMTAGDPTHTSAATQQLVTAAAVGKCEPFQGAGPYHTAAVVQAQLHLPVVPGNGALASAPSPSVPALPPYFMKGSIIQLADGELKRVEDLRTEDFLQSAEISGELKIDSSTVERVDGSPTPNHAIIQFSVGEHRAQVSVEVLVEYPFFVFGKGWSSCCPDRTTQLFELPCSKLSVGDVCISLTLKNLRNGSKKAQALDVIGGNSGLFLKPSKVVRGGHCTEQENGLGQRPGARGSGGVAQAENGELSLGEKLESPKTEAGTAGKPTGRKRRWSAPESRKVEKVEEEPPLTLPKPSFIPQEVKICIEGRSNIGK